VGSKRFKVVSHGLIGILRLIYLILFELVLGRFYGLGLKDFFIKVC
jgi:hypothetical protein